MKMSLREHVLTFVLFTCLFEIGSCIRCYDCSSVNNSMCLDPTIYDQETVLKYMRAVDCQQGILATRQDFFCRKIVQTILHKGHDSEVRVTRGCGWVRHRRDCYKADNEDHLETVCQCFSDDCNKAPALSSVALVVTVCVVALRALL